MNNITKSTFIAAWHKVREEKKSNIVAGLDPAVYRMGRGDTGLPEDADLLTWSSSFIKAVAPHVAGIKINQGFFQGVGQREVLKKLVAEAKTLGLLVISDNKVADIGSTNEVWFFYNKELGFDAVTCAPYAGNIEAGIEMAHGQGLGIITMGLMSVPEYKTEMNFTHSETGEKLWKSRIRRSTVAGADGIVVGGTFVENDHDLAECVEFTKESDALFLVPGIGAQGGSIETYLASGVDPKKCMIASSRGVMFPNGSHSTPEEQAAAAKNLQDTFNTIAYE